MAQGYTLIEWVVSLLDSFPSPIFHETIFRNQNSLLSILHSPKVINDKRVAIRKYVILAIEKHDGLLTLDDIIWDFLDYESQYGIIRLNLISNVDPDEDVQYFISSYRRIR